MSKSPETIALAFAVAFAADFAAAFATLFAFAADFDAVFSFDLAVINISAALFASTVADATIFA